MLNRREVLKKAVHDCMAEMYKKAQPSADWDQIVKEFEEGKIDENERVYEQHYLSQEEFKYILDKYKESYNIISHWRDDVEVVEQYLTKGGSKDKYIEPIKDENGNIIESGYSGFEKVNPIKKQISDYILSKLGVDKADEIANDITEIVMNAIDDCKNFYRFDRESGDFSIAICLGASPTVNPNTVKEYWKEKTGEEIEIEERNPKLFWYMDNGYTEEDLEEEFDDPNWKEILDREWKEEVEQRKREEEEKIKQLQEKYNKENQTK